MNLGVYFIIFKLIFCHLNSFPVSENEKINEVTFTEEAGTLFSELAIENLSYETFLIAYNGYNNLINQNNIVRDTILTIIDYSKLSDQERLFVIDIKNQKLLYKSLVAHGKGSGVKLAQSFSNRPSSNQSSLGFFITGKPYYGKHGYSLRIDGIEAGINSNARSRAIVFHGASYVSLSFIKENGRLGRSFGCPALPVENSRKIIESIKEYSCVFIYAPDKDYFQKTSLINPSLYSQIILQ